MSRIPGTAHSRRRARQGVAEGGRSGARSIAPVVVLGTCMVAVLYGNATYYSDNFRRNRHSAKASPSHSSSTLQGYQYRSSRGPQPAAGDVPDARGSRASTSATAAAKVAPAAAEDPPSPVSSKKSLAEEEEQLPEPPAVVAGAGGQADGLVEAQADGGVQGRWDDDPPVGEGEPNQDGGAVQSLTVGGAAVEVPDEAAVAEGDTAGGGGEGGEKGEEQDSHAGSIQEMEVEGEGSGDVESNRAASSKGEGGKQEGDVLGQTSSERKEGEGSGSGSIAGEAGGGGGGEERSDGGIDPSDGEGRGEGGGGLPGVAASRSSDSASGTGSTSEGAEGGSGDEAGVEAAADVEVEVEGLMGDGDGREERIAASPSSSAASTSEGPADAREGQPPQQEERQTASEGDAPHEGLLLLQPGDGPGQREQQEQQEPASGSSAPEGEPPQLLEPGDEQGPQEQEEEPTSGSVPDSYGMSPADDEQGQQEQEGEQEGEQEERPTSEDKAPDGDAPQGLLQPGQASDAGEQQQLLEPDSLEGLLQLGEGESSHQEEEEEQEVEKQQEQEALSVPQDLPQPGEEGQQQDQAPETAATGVEFRSGDEGAEGHQGEEQQTDQALGYAAPEMLVQPGQEEDGQQEEQQEEHGSGGAVQGSMQCATTRLGEGADNIVNIATWKDVPGDEDYRHPLAEENAGKYVTLQKDLGGFNNIRLSLESGVAFAAATGRTFVIPPPFTIWNMNAKVPKKEVDLRGLFSFDKLRESGRVNIITTAEFLEREAFTGQLGVKPGEAVKKLNVQAVSSYLVEVAGQYEGGLPEMHVEHSAFVLPRHLGERVDLKDESYAFAKKWLYGRELLEYREAWQQAKVIHWRAKEARLLAPFYAFVLHADEVAERYHNRLLRDLMHYPEEVYCKASQIISLLKEEDPSGEFSTFHVRRNDFGNSYKMVNLPMADVISNSLDHLRDNEVVYVATDERDLTQFEPFHKHVRVKFMSDYYERAGVSELNPNLLGMLDQIIASHGRTFTGCWLSTFTAYILRLRGHLQKPRTSNFSYYKPRAVYHHEYHLPENPLWMTEWPLGAGLSWQSRRLAGRAHGNVASAGVVSAATRQDGSCYNGNHKQSPPQVLLSQSLHALARQQQSRGLVVSGFSTSSTRSRFGEHGGAVGRGQDLEGAWRVMAGGTAAGSFGARRSLWGRSGGEGAGAGGKGGSSNGGSGAAIDGDSGFSEAGGADGDGWAPPPDAWQPDEAPASIPYDAAAPPVPGFETPGGFTNAPAAAMDASAAAPDVITTVTATGLSAADLGNYPHHLFMQMIEYVQVNAGVPYWEAIILVSIAARIAMLPAVTTFLGMSKRLNMVKPQMAIHQEKMQDINNRVRANPEMKEAALREMKLVSEEMSALLKQHRIHFPKMIMSLFIQFPVFISLFIATRDMGTYFPGYMTGGMDWVLNLNATDPTWTLPIITSASMILLMELGSDMPATQGAEPKVNQKVMFRVMSIVFVPVAFTMPAGVLVYWTTTNIFGMLQRGLFELRPVQQALGWPMPEDMPQPPKAETPEEPTEANFASKEDLERWGGGGKEASDDASRGAAEAAERAREAVAKASKVRHEELKREHEERGLLSQAPSAEAHLYMETPVSRNLWGTTAFSEQGSPFLNYCPHCFQSRGPAAIRARAGGAPWPHFNGERAENGNYLETDEIAVRHGICGDPEQTAAEGDNRYGLENSNYPVLETHTEGGILTVRIVVSTYHWGHIEMFLCDTADLPDGPDSPVVQSCFNKHPLDRAADDEINQPIDPDHRGRFFLDPPCRASETNQDILPGAYAGDVATARFQLPAGVTCEHCVVQMVYYTGNSCSHQGYAEFDQPEWPSECAPSKADWINEGVGLCGDGDRYPEEFWNCADIAITSGGAPPPAPLSTPEPTPSPIDEEMPVTPTPVHEKIPATPAPVHEEVPTTPAPVEGASPFDEETPVTPAGCEYPVEAYQQCGGTGYAGSTCCTAGYECRDVAECFSECRPMAVAEDVDVDVDGGCAEEWGQCGGTGWDGPTCCLGGIECRKLSDHFFQCRPN
eukprot:g14476.t1